MIRKVLSAGHYNTSSVDLLEQKTKLKKTNTIHVRQPEVFTQDKTQGVSECITWRSSNGDSDG
jgi:hypothetical protein